MIRFTRTVRILRTALLSWLAAAWPLQGQLPTRMLPRPPGSQRAPSLTIDAAAWASREQRDRAGRVANLTLAWYTKSVGAPPAVQGPTVRVRLVIGESMDSSAAVGAATPKSLTLFARVTRGASADALDAAIARELFTLWSGRGFRQRTPAESWFARGTTEYFALRALRATGFLSDTAFHKRFDEAFARYKQDTWIGTNSIAQAGAHQAEHGALVLEGGLLLSACLDANLHRASKGARGIDDLLRAMAARFDTAGRPYDNAAIVSLVLERSDDATARGFSRLVEGSAPLALWTCATEVPPP